jgi:hypothetical protein
VIIPASNLRHLMLLDEVTEAVGEHRFHVWAVSTLDEVLALLTGIEPGARQPDGSYPPGSFHAAVMGRLAGFTKALESGTKAGAATGNATPAVNAPTAPAVENDETAPPAPHQPENGG